MRLQNKVSIITGAGAGIGRATAFRFAEEGSRVLLADLNSADIESAVREIESKGGQAAAVRADISKEKDAQSISDAAVSHFGAIDIVVNNAGALFVQPVADTPPKRFDLMMSVNVRAAYLMAYYALPHMGAQRWGHFLTISQAITTTPAPGKVAHTISKMGMTRLAIGIAAEYVDDNIAANALWPRTFIETAATINWGMGDRSQWRTPEIMCDAAMAIFAQEPPTYSGRQALDEEVLRELAGVDNFDHYWCEGKPPANPQYIDGSDPAVW
jgi:citronellol/citronellal dehydrogenase